MEYRVETPGNGWPGCIGMTHIVESFDKAVKIAMADRPSQIFDETNNLVRRYE